MKEFIIERNDAGQRLDRFVAKTVPLLPSSLLQKYIRLKRIKVCGKGAKMDTRLSLGDTIQMYINDDFFDRPTDSNSYLAVSVPNLNIIYEDENIILADKSPGMLCHSDGKWSYNTLIANIQAYLYQNGIWDPKAENSFAPALCNRIDRNTGGIVIAAKNAESLRIINEKIKSREIDKFYLAVVHGKVSPPSGTLEDQLFKDAKKNQVMIKNNSESGSRTAITKYRVLAFSSGLSLVECELFTGRTHQIRAQMAHHGNPLLGDGKYGRESQNRSYDQKGQALYSYKLRFSFKTDSGILNYLKGKIFTVKNVDFVDKYFPGYDYSKII